MSEEVSIVVCCHNSERLLPETLAHLAAQKFSGTRIRCEVIVIDNGSTDQTARVASESWPDGCEIPLRVVAEPKLGLTNARTRGIAEARYDIVCFVDDDNRVDADWVAEVSNVMTQHPEVGACGGLVEAVSDVELPAWFDRFQNYYAVGKQSEQAGDVTESRGYLWGAGLCMRKSAWQTLVGRQFTFLLSDRQGTALSAGGDAELCYGLRSAGWRLWYEPKLKLKHFLPATRLQWSYLRRVSRGFGAATASLDSYEHAARRDGPGTIGQFRRSWIWQTLATVWYLFRKPLKLLRAPFSELEGDADIIEIENLWGRLLEMLKRGLRYNSQGNKVAESTVGNARAQS
jgi:glycosyltransferase involved in cell wall biosynthesis